MSHRARQCHARLTWFYPALRSCWGPVGAWLTGTILLVFAGIGRAIAQREYRAEAPSR